MKVRDDRIGVGRRANVVRASQHSHDLAAVSQKNVLPAPRHSNVLAQSVFELADSDDFHVPIVASRGYNGEAELNEDGMLDLFEIDMTELNQPT
jgi:hypothetical protein